MRHDGVVAAAGLKRPRIGMEQIDSAARADAATREIEHARAEIDRVDLHIGVVRREPRGKTAVAIAKNKDAPSRR